MKQLQILLVENDDTAALYPFSLTHCSWELRFGVYSILERWQYAVPTASVSVSSHRNLHVRSYVERYPNTTPFAPLPTLLVIGNLVISPRVMRKMAEMCADATSAIVFFCDSEAVGLYLPKPPQSPMAAVAALETSLTEYVTSVDISGRIIRRVWEVLDSIDDAVRWDSTMLAAKIDDEAIVHPTTVIDESDGPVLILDHARIHPFSVLSGPTVIGRHSIVKSHSSIGKCAVGPHTRLGGEVHGCVFSGYSNKQHEGFVGHSFIGEWCNLGAGTTTSNLKNTYGNVSVSMPWFTENTHRMFLGSILGDHVRTGIGTCLSTGTLAGTMVNLVADNVASKHIESFTWMVGGSTTQYDVDKAIAVVRTTMARRLVDLHQHTEALLRGIYSSIHG